jgi:excisionase family DNA binding protein
MEFLTRKQICEMLDISLSTFDRLLAEKRLPQPLDLGGRVMRFEKEALIKRLAELQLQEEEGVYHASVN